MGIGSPTPLTTRAAGAALAVAALSAAIVVGVARADGTAARANEHALLAAMNRARAAHGLPPLRLDPRLARAAQDHTRQIVASGRFVHGRFWLYIQREGVPSGRFAETLGWSAPSAGAESRVVSAWLASPEHRAILLGPYRTVGVGLLRTTFHGHSDAVVVTADYRAPS